MSAISEVPHLQRADHLDDHHLEAQRSHQYDPSLDQTHIREHSNIAVPEYDEGLPTALQWLQKVFADPLGKVVRYFISLFPILKWILHYNYKWAYGDLVAGITVGVVLVPQSMSYATLAGLAPQYGLYSSFVGVFIYSFFATSKDVSIGPVAVMSQQVGKVVARILEKEGDKYSAAEIATFLSLICGGIAAAIGVLRLGFILEFISIPAIMGFMSGSAFNIICGQVPALMGISSSLVNTRAASYEIVINTLKNLKHSKKDAAFGLVGLFILYVWKFSTNYGMKRWPRYKAWFFYTQHLRNAIVIIVATAISWGIVHPQKVKFHSSTGKTFKPSISVIGVVPSGLRDVGVMKIPHGILSSMAGEIPVSTVILLLEHIAIAKSFGRVNDYKVVPDQELVAIGVNNLIGTFFNAYPSTGSFSRSALKAKCGVRTPLAGIFTGCVVLLALYELTSAFYYIPKAILSAVIIHAVSDLIASYKASLNFWNVAPLDCGIFLIAVIITVFASIEDGVYFAVCASVVVLLFRVAKPEGVFLGRIQVTEVVNPIITKKSSDSEIISVGEEYEGKPESTSINNSHSTSDEDIEIHQVLSNGSNYNSTSNKKDTTLSKGENKVEYPNTTKNLFEQSPNIKFHTRWVPLNHKNINKHLNVLPPPEGVLVFKPIETFTYPNASRQTDKVNDEAKRLTRRGKPYAKDTGSRPWNDPGPLTWKLPFWKEKFGSKLDQLDEVDNRPPLRIVHFDFSSVASIDATSIQSLVDLRKALNAYADREVEFHFSGILSPWIRRGLLNAGFGSYEADGLISETAYVHIGTEYDLEAGKNFENVDHGYYAAVETNTPFFHLDIPDYV
ncbi:sulfate permease 2 [[Candida] railenensis]|uniref:Sulfate permease 2 n=1 Tax=[Candida] railenensis TaxID=45579 RepID=A0A9P0VYT5_9ASCO|nr:sulfate permease 2 [[Candida] railenensis]